MKRLGHWSSWLLVVSCAVVAGAIVSAHEHNAQTPAAGSPEFERIKTLVGVWHGTSTTGDRQEPATVEYRLTSGSSAVMETLFPGTPHEMVSVYFDRHGKLSMTHYCMLGNQPQMQVIGSGDHRLDFSLAAGSGIDQAAETHMHALTMTWTDPDHLSQAWTLFEGGKAKDTTTITLSRTHE